MKYLFFAIASVSYVTIFLSPVKAHHCSEEVLAKLNSVVDQAELQMQAKQRDLCIRMMNKLHYYEVIKISYEKCAHQGLKEKWLWRFEKQIAFYDSERRKYCFR